MGIWIQEIEIYPQGAGGRHPFGGPARRDDNLPLPGVRVRKGEQAYVIFPILKSLRPWT